MLDPVLEAAAALVEPGGRLLRAEALTGGVSADVVGLEIATAGGGLRRVVFRRHRDSSFKDHRGGIAAVEHGLLVALHGAGLPVPEPLALGDGYQLIEWVDGVPDVAPDELDGALDQMAGFLAHLHALDVAALALPLDAVEQPADALGAILPAGAAGDRAGAALAAGALDLGPTRIVLLHGDYWPGNVLWRARRLVAVIDWEDAALGDRMADLATARVELRCQYGEAAMDRFTAAYLDAAGAPATGSLTAWELYVSAAALDSMAAWGLAPADEAHRRAETTACFDAAAARLG